MPVTTGELPDFKTFRKSVSFLGKHPRVDQQKVPHLLLSLDAKQKLTEDSVRGPLTFRKRFSLQADQAEQANVNGATQKLERVCSEDPAEKVLDTRGSFPSILSKHSKDQRKQTDVVPHQPVKRTLKFRDWTKAKDNDSTPLPLPGTNSSERNHVDTAAVNDKTHFRYHFREENDPYREVVHRNRKYLMDLIGGRISGYPATERKRRLREDEDTATGRVNYHPHPLHHHQQQRHHVGAAAENNRLRHHLSESHSRSVNLLLDQVDIGSCHLKEHEEDPSKQNFSKETVDYHSKEVIIDPLKQTVSDQPKPTTEDPVKPTREDHVKPTLKDQFKRTTEDHLNQTNKGLARFDVSQRNVEVRRRQVQNDGKKAVLDLLRGRSRRPGSGGKCFGVAAAVPEGAQPRKPSRCDFYVFDDLKRGSPSHEADREDVQKYIRDNNLMPPDKENWIKQWLRTVSPSVRDEELEGDPAPPRP